VRVIAYRGYSKCAGQCRLRAFHASGFLKSADAKGIDYLDISRRLGRTRATLGKPLARSDLG
jgi:hypothetical protein